MGSCRNLSPLVQPVRRMYRQGMSTTEAIDLPLTLGRQIAEARRRLHISQAEMAELLHVHRNTVGRWERDIEVPDFAVVVWLSEASGWPLVAFARAMSVTLPWDLPPVDPGGLEVSRRGCNGGTVLDFRARAVEPATRELIAA